MALNANEANSRAVLFLLFQENDGIKIKEVAYSILGSRYIVSDLSKASPGSESMIEQYPKALSHLSTVTTKDFKLSPSLRP